MDRFKKHSLLCILKDNIFYSVSLKKIQISCRVYKEFYDFITKYYNGKFSEFLDISMKNFVQENSELYVRDKYCR